MSEELSPTPTHRRISVHTLVDAFVSNCRRFPDTMVILALLSLWAIINIYDGADGMSDNAKIALTYLLGEGLLLSAAINLWAEFRQKSIKWKHLAQAVCGALLLADTVWLWLADMQSSAAWMGRAAVTTALTVALIFGPAMRMTDRRTAWLYSYSFLSGLFTAAVVAVVMEIAVLIFYFTIHGLFGTTSEKPMLTAMVLACCTLPAVILLSRFPTREGLEADPESYAPGRFTIGFVKYLIVPLTVIYMAIIYIYGVRILVLLELPRGMVSAPVAGAVGAVVLSVFMLRGICAPESGLRHMARTMALATLPLLVLMSIAVFHRIGQYGITAPRLYLATFNIWAYGAMIWLGMKREQHFYTIPASMAALFLLVSVIPGANYVSASRHYMHSRIESALRRAGATQLPLSYSEATRLSHSMNREEWRQVSSWVDELTTTDDWSATSDLFSFAPKKNNWLLEAPFVNRYDSDYDPVIGRRHFTVALPDRINVMPGYDKVKYTSFYSYSEGLTDGHCLYSYSDMTIDIPVDSLLDLDSKQIKNLHFVTISNNGGRGVLVPSEVDIRVGLDSEGHSTEIEILSVTGILFTND